MATKHQVIQLNSAHPDWSARRIAEDLRCSPAYVRATGYRNSLKFPRGSHREGSVYDLGLACRAVGLTLRDILDISEKRGLA